MRVRFVWLRVVINENYVLLKVTLEAEVSNKGALALYGRLGFIRAKRLYHYYLNGMDAFRLKLLFPKPRVPQILSQDQTQQEQEQENFTG